eukprot:4396904-Amphidinium_carterae.3
MKNVAMSDIKKDQGLVNVNCLGSKIIELQELYQTVGSVVCRQRRSKTALPAELSVLLDIVMCELIEMSPFALLLVLVVLKCDLLLDRDVVQLCNNWRRLFACQPVWRVDVQTLRPSASCVEDFAIAVLVAMMRSPLLVVFLRPQPNAFNPVFIAPDCKLVDCNVLDVSQDDLA